MLLSNIPDSLLYIPCTVSLITANLYLIKFAVEKRDSIYALNYVKFKDVNNKR